LAGGGVAGDAVPAGAAVSGVPCVEDAQVGFGQGSFEGQECCPL